MCVCSWLLDRQLSFFEFRSFNICVVWSKCRNNQAPSLTYMYQEWSVLCNVACVGTIFLPELIKLWVIAFYCVQKVDYSLLLKLVATGDKVIAYLYLSWAYNEQIYPLNKNSKLNICWSILLSEFWIVCVECYLKCVKHSF